MAAAQEKWLSRKKNDCSFPRRAFEYCLQQGQIECADLDYICYYDKPLKKLARIVKTHLTYAPAGIRSFLKTMPAWINNELGIKESIAAQTGFAGKIIFTEHHQSHAASAFFPSPFEKAAFLIIDGAGEWATTSYGVASGNAISIQAEILFPHSLSDFSRALACHAGFHGITGENKLLDLASFGEPKYKQVILSELIELTEDGSFQLNMNFFDIDGGLLATNHRFDELIGRAARRPGAPLRKMDMDLACSTQEVIGEVVLTMVDHVHKKTNEKNLCLAGDLSLNARVNGQILRESAFNDIWVQPAVGDSGGALGAALFAWHHYLGKPKKVADGVDLQTGSLLGPSFSNDSIRKFLDTNKVIYTELSDQDIAPKIADRIIEQKVVGWFQGRMEYGPGALGNRSILADARSIEMREVINTKIKGQENFVSLSASVLQERVRDYFDLDHPSPYKLFMAHVKEEICPESDGKQNQLTGFDRLKNAYSSIPAVTNCHYQARVQTVNSTVNPLFYDLLKAFDEKTSCGVIVNTSFEIDGEPIVCSPEDAYRCFINSDLDCLIMGSFFVEKMT